MSVSAAAENREGLRWAMFMRWKKAVFVTWLTWGVNERSRMFQVSSLVYSYTAKMINKVADLGGGGQSGAINVEREGLGGAGERVWADDEDVRFIAGEFEAMRAVPGELLHCNQRKSASLNIATSPGLIESVMTECYTCSACTILPSPINGYILQLLPVSCFGGAQKSHLCGMWQEALLQSTESAKPPTSTEYTASYRAQCIMDGEPIYRCCFGKQ